MTDIRYACCHTRLGKPKRLYPSKPAAQSVADKMRNAHGMAFTFYPCINHEGKFHVKKVRDGVNA